jgi:hypothetical protein
LILGYRSSSRGEFLLAPIHPPPPLVAFSGPSIYVTQSYFDIEIGYIII